MAQQDIQTWLSSAYADQYLRAQGEHLNRAVRTAASPTTLVIGRIGDHAIIDKLDLPFVCRVTIDSEQLAAGRVDVVASNAFLPFPEKSFATVVLLHGLETSDLPHQTLREAHRVLQADGHLVLAGFNPFSLLGLQRLVRTPALPKGQIYGLRRVLDWLNLLDFEVVGSSMFQYGPLSRHARLRRYFAFLESVGDRWFPLLGGAYMLVARKREIRPNLIGLKRRTLPQKARQALPIKSSLK
ncbi:MAG: methyltransferase domain-containing protein [Arenicella sp.]|nr:methyltransferase domain-containing protein [Arenicella sp.]